MTAADIQPEALKEWLSEAEADNPVYRAYPRCPKHKVFLSCLGCKICIEDDYFIVYSSELYKRFAVCVTSC